MWISEQGHHIRNTFRPAKDGDPTTLFIRLNLRDTFFLDKMTNEVSQLDSPSVYGHLSTILNVFQLRISVRRRTMIFSSIYEYRAEVVRMGYVMELFETIYET
jgi:hypothetical protein